ncbi:hypothetical protein ABIF42_006203 [Bradyrhizobium diazoefficiens]
MGHLGGGSGKDFDPDGGPHERSVPLPNLFETMLRALNDGPAQFERVAALLEVLRKAPNSSQLLSSDFQAVWNPIWDNAKRGRRK